MKIFMIFCGFVVVLSCKAQQLPLNTWMENTPNNAHLKDLGNELAPYLGIYKANYKGNEITLFITKEEDKLIKYHDKQFYKDVLVIKYIVKNSSGITIQDTQNINHQSYFKITSMGTMPELGKVALSYSGTNCGVGWGQIDLKKLNDMQISWDYYPNNRIISDATCPPGTDTTVYLPHTKGLVFTKQ
ncbi:DUF6705 family protein [Chryseobacterium indoltheticum]|nr:DUF6705 family protein [Chryseobacterium indoltheticum]QQQ29946.1 hypothetical protein JJL46_08065 [Chryseobacterium indoltheticum]